MRKYNEEDDRYHTEGVAEAVLELLPEGSTCIDVGAYHWGWLSNSWLLEEEGWDVYCIEPNPHCVPLLASRKKVYDYAISDRNEDDVNFYIYHMGHGPTGEAGATGLILTGDGSITQHLTDVIRVKVRTLDWFLTMETDLTYLDFLSVDTEGTELDVLRGINLEKWGVPVISVEAIEQFADQEQELYLAGHGYRKVDKLVFNSIYVKEE